MKNVRSRFLKNRQFKLSEIVFYLLFCDTFISGLFLYFSLMDVVDKCNTALVYFHLHFLTHSHSITFEVTAYLNVFFT